MKDVAAELAAWRAAGERVAIATVVRVEGSAPRPVGASLVAAPGDRIAGSVSNGCVESAVYEEAMATLAEGRARLVHYGISDEFAFTVGLSCGGAIDVLVEPVGRLHDEALAALGVERSVALARFVTPPDRLGAAALWAGDRPGEGWSSELAPLAAAARESLRDGGSRTVPLRLADGREAAVFLHALPRAPRFVIVGATHVAIPLARFAKTLGYRVVVADPRAPLANRERFPDADEIVLAWPDEALAQVRLDAASAVVVVTHDPKFDHPALVAALRSEAGYVGAIGSRRTSEKRFAWLRGQGFSGDDIERIHAPVGLDIGARTAEEIALAIVAEVVAAQRRRPGMSLSARALAAVP